jgi:hypothetical protein
MQAHKPQVQSAARETTRARISPIPLVTVQVRPGDGPHTYSQRSRVDFKGYQRVCAQIIHPKSAGAEVRVPFASPISSFSLTSLFSRPQRHEEAGTTTSAQVNPQASLASHRRAHPDGQQRPKCQVPSQPPPHHHPIRSMIPVSPVRCSLFSSTWPASSPKSPRPPCRPTYNRLCSLAFL